ncbi:MAG: hypothetical protein IT258_12145, partial [Saprospiraceae bacterium]|nr:hypothetical protein [Saprospiraceae bacterium]
MKFLPTLIIAFCTVINSPLYSQWTEVPMPEGASLWSLAINGDVAYTASQGIAARSTDGKSWTQIPNFNFLDPNDAAEFTVENGNVYLYYHAFIGERYLLKSEDNGISWDSIQAGDPPTSKFYFHGDRIFKGNDNKLYKTDNDGQTWEQLAFQFPLGQFILDFKVWNNKLYITTYGGVWVSEDAGINWSLIAGSPASNGNNLAGLHMYPCGSVMFIEHYELGLYRSFDGNNWELLPNNLADNWSIGDMQLHQGRIYAATFSAGLIYSEDFGDNWTMIESQPNETHCLDIYDGKLCTASYAGFFIFDAAAQTWQSGNINLPPQNFIYTNYVYDIASAGQNLLVVNDLGRYHSDDNGLNYYFGGWSGWGGGKLIHVGNAIINSNYFTANISFDDGVNWQSLTLPDSSFSQPDFTYANGMLFVVDNFDSQFWKSPDYGQTWAVVPTGNLVPSTDIEYAEGKLFSFDYSTSKVISSS